MAKKLFNEFGVPHEILEDSKFKKISASTQVLYIHLCKLRNRYSERYAKNLLKKYNFIEVKRGQYVHGKQRSPDWYRVNGYKLIFPEKILSGKKDTHLPAKSDG